MWVGKKRGKRVKKWRGNCKELGHTCTGLKEAGRDRGRSVTLVGEREDRREEGSFLVCQADRKGCENHSLGFQHSFMEGEWRKAREKAEPRRLLKWEKGKYNQLFQGPCVDWAEGENQNERLTLCVSGRVCWVGDLYFFWCALFCFSLFEHVRAQAPRSHRVSSL